VPEMLEADVQRHAAVAAAAAAAADDDDPAYFASLKQQKC
jgi:hypothetical protein